MWDLLLSVLVSTAIASPAPRMSGNADAPQSLTILPRMIKARCDRNGDASTYTNYIEASDRYERNLEKSTIFFVTDKMSKNYYNLDPNDPDVRAEMICRLNTTYKTGVVNMAATVRPCVRDEYRQILDRVPEMVDSLFEQMCSNGRRSFYPHLTQNEAECVRGHTSKIIECFENFVGDILKPFEPITKEKEEQQRVNRDQPLLDFKTCVKNELDQCPNSFTSFTDLPQTVLTVIGIHRLF